MEREKRTQQTYDHGLRQLVHSTGNVQLALDLGVPRSTARGCRVLRALGLSARRYHAWMKADQECTLDDAAICPQSVPHQLTPDEVSGVAAAASANRRALPSPSDHL